MLNPDGILESPGSLGRSWRQPYPRRCPENLWAPLGVSSVKAPHEISGCSWPGAPSLEGDCSHLCEAHSGLRGCGRWAQQLWPGQQFSGSTASHSVRQDEEGCSGSPRGVGWSEACVLVPVCCRQCALAALRDVKSYLTKEGGQIAVSLRNYQLLCPAP